MAKYKKKKSTSDGKSPPEKAAPVSTANQTTNSEDPSKKPKRIASGTLKLQFAGDLILVKNSQKSIGGLFKRFAALFETMANMPKEQRNLAYKLLTGLMLTSHAKKINSSEERKKLFDLKNQIFLNIANDRAMRRLLEFKYLVSKNFRVISYCENCQKSNTELGHEKHKWKYCKQCQVDHNFYNLLSMETRFPQGFARMFISNDQIPKLEYFRLPPKIKSDVLKEEAMIEQFHYNARNLDAIDLASVLSLHEKLMTTTQESTSKDAKPPRKIAPRVQK